jgi:drug/metabolite transporter (DMT)-like permease
MKYLAFLLVARIWGTTWTAIKLSLSGYPLVIGATLRFVFAIAMGQLNVDSIRIRRSCYGK